VLTVSDTVRREIESRYPGSNVLVTPNGVDDVFRADAPRQQ
jgi:hypothetical protein